MLNTINEQDLIHLVKDDEWMMDILIAAKSLNLPDWWVCAGFLRSKIWDVLHGFTERTPMPDVDVIYFDNSNLDEHIEKELEKKLRTMNPNIPWSVKNEARMHLVNNLLPYSSSVDAISKFPETATALGLKLDDQYNVILAAPYGIEDLVNLELKPTAFFAESSERVLIYEERIVKKNWQAVWDKLKVTHL
ncbi:nucleotidyltransferase family protein [Paenibacillus sp. DS2015]|uniref:nucleotidyltransferase family protein n=1 Tax=Paenibacillus sp. DS2015 TaxID=3373917 RepID=UPI003D1AE5DB